MADEVFASPLPNVPVTNLVPPAGTSIFITGQSGSGKSTLTRMLASHLAGERDQPGMSVVVVDHKPPYKVFSGKTVPYESPWSSTYFEHPQLALQALVAGRRRIWYRPSTEFRKPRYERIPGLSRAVRVSPIEQFLSALYRYYQRTMKPFAIVVCDSHGLFEDTQPGDGSRDLQYESREGGITKIWEAQRCKGLPLYLISESQRRYVFHLGHDADYTLMRRMIGDFDNPPRHEAVIWLDDQGIVGSTRFGVRESAAAGPVSPQARTEALRDWAPTQI